MNTNTINKNINKIIRKCSICRKHGHNKRTCNTMSINNILPKIECEKNINKNVGILQTEDTGKIFEMAICVAYGISYNGKYKYGMEVPDSLKYRLLKLVDLFPLCKHNGNKNRYDYTSITDQTKHLSAKTSKKGIGKVSPQVIGQCQPVKFCDILGIYFVDIFSLKEYIQLNIKKILPILVNYTFGCPNIYYNQEQNTIRFIKLEKQIYWNDYKFKWTRDYKIWTNSSTLKIITKDRDVSLIEFQFHTKNRTNMAIRWCYENFLYIFKDNLDIIDI